MVGSCGKAVLGGRERRERGTEDCGDHCNEATAAGWH